MTRYLLVAIALFPGVLGRPPQPSRTLAVAAASDLQALVPELAARFERETGTRVTATFGSSGNFFAQIQNGAPFDLFMSADVDYPQRLISAGHADAGTLYVYATGRIVLWTRKDSGVDVSRGLAVLREPAVKKVAIANPRHAPYGRAAEAALRHEQLYDAVEPKLVLGENISQAAQLVESGNAQAGILALSLARGPRLATVGAFAEIPADWHSPLQQAAVVLTAAKDKDVARRFVAMLATPAAVELLRRFGFTPPASGR